MTERVIRVGNVSNPQEFFGVFFPETAGVVPDYGGRGLDALLDDLGDIEEPLSLVIEGLELSAAALGDWLDRMLGTLALAFGRSSGRLSVTLRAAP